MPVTSKCTKPLYKSIAEIINEENPGEIFNFQFPILKNPVSRELVLNKRVFSKQKSNYQNDYKNFYTDESILVSQKSNNHTHTHTHTRTLYI